MLLTHFYRIQGEKRILVCTLASREYFGIKPITFLSINLQKDYPLVK